MVLNDPNRNFILYANEYIDEVEVFIFNRWGELIYTITSFDDFWDGTYKGIKSQDGTYVWKIRYYGFEDDNVYEQTGHVNLLR